MFKDELTITVSGGKGGSGCSSLRRDAFKPKGGPDGGNGGHGGSVILCAQRGLRTLIKLNDGRHYKAKPGKPGESNDRDGRKGEDIVIPVPVGTIVFDADTNLILRDLKLDRDECVVAEGGAGGRGNKSYASPTRQTPRHKTDGGNGESRRIRLELRLIADVGLIGKPNAGKSTLLSRLSAARPKIADYPFTTLSPVLGIVDAGDDFTFVIADIPGLIEGAHEGRGLGDKFLRHVERTRILVHLVELVTLDGSDPAENYFQIKRELAMHSETLANKPTLLVVNKVDEPGSMDALARFEEITGKKALPISALTGEGFTDLIRLLVTRLRKIEEDEAPSEE
ncbi:MAG: GTPase ObgE [Planctomycetes bacterium]|nr:GTPase ObgE [Planctomycetota bacterium]